MARPGYSTLSRREFLRILAVAGGGLLVSCRPGQIAAPNPITPSPTIFSTARPSPPSPASTQGLPMRSPAPTQNILEKIGTVIILLQENHSFDSLFGSYPGVNGKSAPNRCPEVIVRAIPEGGTSIFYYCTYTQAQVPNYWKLAQNFTLCDDYFSEVRLASFPNYSMLTTAQATTLVNPAAPYECPHYCADVTSLANRLDDKGLTWHDYGGLLANIKSLQGRPEISYRQLDGFFQAASAGTLANVSWIGSYLVGGTKDSGHPPGNICEAENFTVQIVNAALTSPQWPSMLIIVIWDEWGNFYDHVVPPILERLPNKKPFRYGFRVPCLVISPYARPGFISHTEFSHVSTLRTVEHIFGLPSLTERDATANSLVECLDFNQPPISPISLVERTCLS